jgi:hypothetical protein
MSQYHEPPEEVPAHIRDYTRILVSLKEEIEAVDWYNQRIELATNDMARRILEHNRDEEMEHACMALEWLRRNMPGWDDAMRTYLFTDRDILELEDEAMGGDESQGTGDLHIRKPGGGTS